MWWWGLLLLLGHWMQHGCGHEGLGAHQQRGLLRGEGGPQEGLGLLGPKGRGPTGALLLERLQPQGPAFHLAPMPRQAVGSVAELGVDEDLAPGAIHPASSHGSRVMERPLLLLLLGPKLHQARPRVQGKRGSHPGINVLLRGVAAVAAAGRSAASRCAATSSPLSILAPEVTATSATPTAARVPPIVPKEGVNPGHVRLADDLVQGVGDALAPFCLRRGDHSASAPLGMKPALSASFLLLFLFVLEGPRGRLLLHGL